MAGYTQPELDHIQTQWKLRFPPDLVALMRERRLRVGWVVRSDTDLRRYPVDWISSPNHEIEEVLTQPIDSFLSSMERNKRWWPEWGEWPKTEAERHEKLSAVLADAPRLIPIDGRYLPSEPYEEVNPVISIAGCDAIYYGANLQDWLAREG